MERLYIEKKYEYKGLIIQKRTNRGVSTDFKTISCKIKLVEKRTV